MKTFKPGEVVVQGGEKITAVTIIQSGHVAALSTRENTIEAFELKAGQCTGEETLARDGNSGETLVAIKETTVDEIPLERLRPQLENTNMVLKALVRGLSERVRTSLASVKEIRSSKGYAPCPPVQTANLFGLIFHMGRLIGETTDSGIRMGWSEFINQAVGLYRQNADKLEQAALILQKLGYAKLEGTEEGVQSIELKNMTQLENFFEFYQNYYFRPGGANILRTDPKIAKIASVLIEIASKHKVDRMGVVRIPYKPTIDHMKEIFGKTFEGDQLFRLEPKGLLLKRISTPEGGVLSFMVSEFQQTLVNWKILKEIELWNEKGSVQMETAALGEVPSASRTAVAEEETFSSDQIVVNIRTGGPAPGEILCPTCMSVVQPNQKECHVCNSVLEQKTG